MAGRAKINVMSTSFFDTLTTVSKLEAAGMTRSLAETLVSSELELIEAVVRSVYATSQSVADTQRYSETVDKRVDKTDTTIELLDGRIGGRFDAIDSRFDRIADRIDRLSLELTIRLGGIAVVCTGLLFGLFKAFPNT